MRFFAAAMFFFGTAASHAQGPEVPGKMKFAGMTLTIREDARQEIQKDVDALTQHSRYYMLKVERAKTYFPIIEKIFEEEHVPDDFKYLVLQESALVPDAVSGSNAVGFWQFKDFTAIEMGLRVDQDIDERMNLISATRGAARYLKQNNFYFNNWLYALQSYQMGAGGVKRSTGDLQNGARNMEITAATYWYVKKFLAHKVAFEGIAHGDAQVRVLPYQTNRAKSLKEIAAEVSSEENVLREYNKWLKTDVIPVDKAYTVLIPVGKLDVDFNKLMLTSTKASKAEPLRTPPEPKELKVNGIASIRARPGETVAALAERSGISLTAFLRYNDIVIDHAVVSGSLYLLGKKKNRANENFGKVKPGDNLWAISQRYGVQLRKLMKYNRIKGDQQLEPGSEIWLSSVKSKDVLIPLHEGVEVAQLNEDQSFDWYLKSPSTTESIPPIGSSAKIPEPRADTMVNVDPSALGQNVPSPSTYMVKPGDTFYSIAAQNATRVTNLLAWNDLSIQTALVPGQVLKINSDKAVDGNKQDAEALGIVKTVVYDVKSTDTLFGIARQFGITINDLLEWNNKKDLTLTVGEKLRIVMK